MMIKTLFFLVGFSAISFTFLGDDWVFKKEENGIKVYTAKKDGSDFEKCKVLTTINSSIDELYEYIRTPSNYKKFSSKISKVKVVSKTEKSVVYYLSLDMPWPVYDRDGIYELKTIEKTDEKLVLKMNARPKLLKEQTGFVRVEESYTKYSVTKDGDFLDVIYEKFADPNGSVPAWLTNFFLIDGPIDQFTQIKKDLE